MRGPYFSNGMTCSQVAAELGLDTNRVRNVVWRYKLPRDAADPVSMVKRANDFLVDCKAMRIRPNRLRLMANLQPKTVTEIRPNLLNDKTGFLRSLRAVQKHPLYKTSFGIDVKEEINDVISMMVDQVIFGE